MRLAVLALVVILGAACGCSAGGTALKVGAGVDAVLINGTPWPRGYIDPVYVYGIAVTPVFEFVGKIAVSVQSSPPYLTIDLVTPEAALLAPLTPEQEKAINEGRVVVRRQGSKLTPAEAIRATPIPSTVGSVPAAPPPPPPPPWVSVAPRPVATGGVVHSSCGPTGCQFR